MSNLFKKAWARVLMIASALIMASCTTEEAPVAVTGVTLSESSLMLFTGQSETLIATVAPDNAANPAVRWSTSDAAVATVSDKGVVTAAAVGTATITVTTEDGGKTASCTVTVMSKVINVESVALNKTATTINRGETEQLTATISPADASVKDVTWTTSNEAVATVSEEGLVSAVALGTATITVTTMDGNKTATCEITVDASEFTVKFVTNGAGEIADVVVAKGETLTKPEDPSKGGIDMGLYEGNIDPDAGAFAFDGWYTDEALTAAYDFATPVTSDFTLYAKWNSEGAPTPIELLDAEGNPLDFGQPVKAVIDWLNLQYPHSDEVTANNGKEYTLVLTQNTESGNGNLQASVKLHIKGQGERRTLKLKWGQTELNNHAEVYVHNNVTLTCSGGHELLRMHGSTKLYLLEGSQIADCDLSPAFGVIYNDSASAYVYLQGGEIINNKVASRTDGWSRCSIICCDNGRVRLESGRIADNVVTAAVADTDRHIAGAIVTNCATWNEDSIRKTGGVIENNKAVLAEGATAKMGQQVLSMVRDIFTPLYYIDGNIDEATACDTGKWAAETWAEPWVKLAE